MKKVRIFFKKTFLGRALVWAATYLVLLFQALPAMALPEGETVVHGEVTFERNGSQMTVNQGTGRAIVNYNGFGIESGEGVRFAQPDANAAILNRVTGAGSSTIAGQLSANGRVFLINPNGILFTPSAQVDVGALVASALNMSDSDFLAGNLRFSGGGGPVVNQGTLNGGFVYLIGGTVENQGTINASDVALAAGQSVVIDKAGDGEIRLTIDEEIVSSNQVADSSASGVPDDTSASSTNSTSDAGADAEWTNAVNQAAQSASTVWELGTVVNEGIINVSGDVGGMVLAHGTQVGQFGTINADGLVGDGGKIDLYASDVVAVSADSLTTANAGLNGDGGQILIVGEHAAAIATGARIEAKGGTQSGNGGFVETSGKESFRIGAAPDVSASHGQGGTWLIDPYNIVITNGNNFANIPTDHPFDATDSNAVLGVDLIYSALTNSTFVSIYTGNGGSQAGNITWLSGADLNYDGIGSPSTLSLHAANNITINANIYDRTPGDGDSLNLSLSGGGNITIGGTMNLKGNFDSKGVNFTHSGTIATTGNIDINHTGNVSLGAALNAGSGNISLKGSSINQSGGALTANQLSFNSSGAVTLDRSGNNVQTVIGGAGGAINLRDTSTLTLTSVTNTSGGIHVLAGGPLVASNVVAGGFGNITLTNTSGDMTVQILTATDDQISLSSRGSITQQVGGAVTADGLIFQAGTNVTLYQPGNNVRTVTGGAGGVIKLRDTDTLTLASVTNAGGGIHVLAEGSLVASNVVAGGSGNITLTNTSGDMTVQILTATDDQISLSSRGSITQQVGGAVTADGLIFQAGTNVTLYQPGNNVRTVTGGAGGVIKLRDTDTLTLASVTNAGGGIHVLAGGSLVASNVVAGGSGNITLTNTSGDMTVQILTATDDQISLSSRGSITQQVGGAVTADGLIFQAGTNVTLYQPGNNVRTVTGGAGGVIKLRDTDTLTLASVTNAGGGIEALAGSTLTVSNVVAGGSGNVTLTTSSGDVVIDHVTAAGGAIRVMAAGAIQGTNSKPNLTSSTLNLQATDGIGASTNNPLEISALYIEATNSGNAGIYLRNWASDGHVRGLSTRTGNISFVQSSGNLNLYGNVTSEAHATPSGTNFDYPHYIRMVATNGDIIIAKPNIVVGGSPDSPGPVKTNITGNIQNANYLEFAKGVDIIFEGGTNPDVYISSPYYSSDDDMDLTLSARRDLIINSGVEILWTKGGLSITLLGDNDHDGIGGVWLMTNVNAVADRNITISGSDLFTTNPPEGTGILIDDDVQLRAGGNVAITTPSLGTTPVLGSNIVFSGTITNGGDTSITAGYSFLSSESSKIYSRGNVEITALRGDSFIGGAMAPSNVTITAAGHVTISNSIVADDRISITAGTNISQTGGALIANGLEFYATGNVALAQSSNQFATVAGRSVTGSVSLADNTNSLLIGVVGMHTGLVAGMNIVVTNTGNLVLGQSVNSGSATTRLVSTSGSINQTNGTLTASGLEFDATGDVTLAQSENNFTTVAGYSATGSISLANSHTAGLTVGIVGEHTGLVASVGDIVVTNTGNLFLSQLVRSAANTKLHSTGGSINGTQTVFAANLLLLATNGIGTNGHLAVEAAKISATNFGRFSMNIENSHTNADILGLASRGGDISYTQLQGYVVITGEVNSALSEATHGGNITINATATDGWVIVSALINSKLTNNDAGGGSRTINQGVLFFGSNTAAGVTAGAGSRIVLGGGNGEDLVISSTNFLTYVGGIDPLTLEAKRDILVRTNISSASLLMPLGLVADSDTNGQGGVWIETSGAVHWSNNVFLAGSDIYHTSRTGDSVFVEGEIQSSGHLTITAGVDVVINTNVFAGDLIHVVAGTRGGTGNIFLADSGFLSAKNASGKIELSAANSLYLTGMVQAVDRVSLQAGDGEVFQGGGAIHAQYLEFDATGNVTLAQSGNEFEIVAGRSVTGSVSLVDNVGELMVAQAGIHTEILAGANILVTNSGNVVLNANVTSMNGSISVLAATNVYQNTGGNITVENNFGTIDVEGMRGSVVMAGGTVSQTRGGNIRYKAGQDVTLGQLNVDTGTVSVVAERDILNGNESGNNVTAGSLRLQAGRDIAVGTNRLATAVDMLAANSVRNQYVDNARALTVGMVSSSVNRVNADSNLIVTNDAGLAGLTAGGHAKITAVGSLTVNQQAHAGTNLLLKSTMGDVVLNTGVSSTNGSISVLAANSVTQNTDIMVSSGLGSIDVAAQGGSILMASGTMARASGGTIRYEANQDVALSRLMTPGGVVSVIASNITDANGGANNLTASGARLIAGESMGTGTNHLETTVDTLAAQAGSNVYVDNSKGLTVGTVDANWNRVNADSTLTVANDGVRVGINAGRFAKLTANGTIWVTNAVNAGTNLLLNATAGDIVLNAKVMSTKGSISVLAANSVTQNADIVVSSGLGSIDVAAQGSSILMASGTMAQASGGTIRYEANQDVALSRLMTPGGVVSVIASNIADANGDANNLTASGARLIAGESMGTGANHLETTVDTLAAQAGSNVYVDNSKELTVGTVGADWNRVKPDSTLTVANDGAIAGINAGRFAKLTANGTMWVTNAVNAGTNLLLNATAGDIVLNAKVMSTNGNISVLAANSVTQNADIVVSSGLGSIDVAAQDGSILMAPDTMAQASGTIRYEAGQDVTLNRLVTPGGVVSVKAGNDIVNNGTTNNIMASEARLMAGGSIGRGTNHLETTVDMLAAQAGSDGYVDNSKGLTVGTVDANWNRVNADSTLTVTNDGAIAGINAGRFAKLTANGTIRVTNAVNAGTSLLLNATADNVVLNAGVTSTNGSISVLAANSVTQNADIVVSSGLGSIDVAAQDGSILMASDTMAQASGGTIRYEANQDVTLSRLVTSDGVVSVIASNITDANGGANNLTAGQARLVAGKSIATANDRLETTVDTLAAQAGSNVYVDNSKGLTVGTVGANWNRVNANSTLTTTNDGAIAGINAGQFAKLTANGTIWVTNAVNAGTNLLLSATDGDVVLNANVTSINGNISVLAANSVTQNADIVVLSGKGSIDVEGTTGSIVMMSDASAITSNGNGNIRYWAGQDVELGQLDAGIGVVSVTAGSNIVNNGTANNITASGARLEAGEFVGTASNHIKMAVDIIAAEAAQGINVTNVTKALTVGTVGPVKVNRVLASSTVTQVVDNALTGLVTKANQSIIIMANGTITVSNEIHATGGGIVFLYASNSVADVIVNADILADSSNITVIAENHIALNSNITANANGTIALWADHDSQGGGDVTQTVGTVQSADGNIFVAGFNIYQSSNGVIQTTGLGSIIVKASNNLEMAGTISSGSGNLAMGAGQMVINGTLNAGGTLILRADKGSIIGDGKATAQNIGLSAFQDIGISTNRLFNVDAETLATHTDSGDVYLKEASSVKAGLVSFPNINDEPQDTKGNKIPVPNIENLDYISSHGNLDLVIGGNLSGTMVSAGASADISVGSAIDNLDTIDIGRNANIEVNGSINNLDTLHIQGDLKELKVNGSAEIKNFTIDGEAIAEVGGGLKGTEMTIGHDANLTVGGDTSINQLDINGAFSLNGGGGFSFDDLKAGQVDATVGGSIDMGIVEAGTAVFKAGGSVNDNNSLLNVSALTIEAGGNIGDAGKPIHLNVGTIDNIFGNNIYLLQNVAGDLMVNTITARNHLDLGVPNGRILDAQNDGDQPTPPINIRANSARLDAQQIGERRDPLEVEIAGNIEVVNSKLGPDQGPGFVWVHLQGDVGNKVVPDYNQNVPGLIILNNQVVGGADAVMREIFRTEAFYVETPELKSKYGVFGSPYFLHSYLQISEPASLGFIDYILYGEAKVNADPDLPPIPNIIKGGPKAGYVVRLTTKPLIP